VVAHAARSLMTMRLHRRFGDPVSAGVGDVKGVLGPGEITDAESGIIPSPATSSGESTWRTFAPFELLCVIVGGSEICPFDGR
jgi:hypothetical protein